MAKVLILGGTAEAAELAARLAGDDRLETVTSMAGLTRLPAAPSGKLRRGGFGGPDGLTAVLREDGYAALVDATHPFADIAAAVEYLPQGARVFVAAGRREAAAFAARPDLWCLVRMIEPPAGPLPRGEVILGRPPIDPQREIELLQAHRIGWIVSKDSGGQAGAKMTAARRLKLPVVLVERPPAPAGPTVADVEGVLEWIETELFAGQAAR